jgi:predicted component of type VI protein secretion system
MEEINRRPPEAAAETNKRDGAHAYAWLLRVARLYKPYEADMQIPQHLLSCDRYLVECDQCIKEVRAYLKARRQSVEEYINL